MVITTVQQVIFLNYLSCTEEKREVLFMKRVWAVLFAIMLAVAICTSALTEGLEIEYDESFDLAVMAAEMSDEEDVEITSQAVELPVPEALEALLPRIGDETGDADAEFVGEFAVSAAGDVAIDKINFPDASFRKYVAGNFDKDGDGTLSEDECAAIDEISVSSKGITNLKGIEWFRNLTWLNCGSNQLTSLDVSGCTALKNLICYGNQLTSLDVSKCTALEELHCDSNQLMSLDVSKNAALEFLDCSFNQLTSLDVSKNTALWGLSCSSNQLTSLDVSKCTALEELFCDSNQLTSLDVGRCSALEALHCTDNQLTSLDVSTNTALEELLCQRNQMTNLNLSNCTALNWLDCHSNQLKSLDVSTNTALNYLGCSSNQLTSLNVSKCTALDALYCNTNQLTSLDVSKGTTLNWLSCYNNRIADIDISNCKSLIAAASERPETTKEGSLGFGKNGTDDSVWYILEIDRTTALTANGKVIYAGEQKTAKNLAKAKVTVKDKAYTGKALKPKVTVKLNGVTLKKGTDYTISYKNNVNIGKATVTVKGVGKYTGTKKAAFTIKPKKVSGLNLKAGKKQLTATWKQAAGGVTGYQIQYGLTKDFKGAKKVTVKKTATVEKVLKKLKTGKAYYVRIRAYRKVGKKTYWSDWSKAVKSKKVK